MNTLPAASTTMSAGAVSGDAVAAPSVGVPTAPNRARAAGRRPDRRRALPCRRRRRERRRRTCRRRTPAPPTTAGSRHAVAVVRRRADHWRLLRRAVEKLEEELLCPVSDARPAPHPAVLWATASSTPPEMLTFPFHSSSRPLLVGSGLAALLVALAAVAMWFVISGARIGHDARDSRGLSTGERARAGVPPPSVRPDDLVWLDQHLPLGDSGYVVTRLPADFELSRQQSYELAAGSHGWVADFDGAEVYDEIAYVDVHLIEVRSVDRHVELQRDLAAKDATAVYRDVFGREVVLYSAPNGERIARMVRSSGRVLTLHSVGVSDGALIRLAGAVQRLA